jgi:uncharacterized membrane protein
VDRKTDITYYGLVAAVGLIAGFRSVSAPATVATLLERGDWPGDADPAVALAARFAPALRGAAVVEMAADKLPMMPDRTIPPVLAGRILIGAASGALLARAAQRSAIVAALLGGLLAVAGAYAGLNLRRLLGDGLGLPNVPAGLIEDAAVIGGASAVVGLQARPEPLLVEG